mgnify:FL=1
MRKEVIDVVAAVIERDGEYLLTQRKSTAVLPLLWEFPGGKVEPRESKAAALVREVRGRIGLVVIIGDTLGENVHSYHSNDVRMTLYSSWLPARCQPTAIGVQQLRWVPSEKLGNYEFPPADQHTMSQLLNLSS